MRLLAAFLLAFTLSAQNAPKPKPAKPGATPAKPEAPKDPLQADPVFVAMTTELERAKLGLRLNGGIPYFFEITLSDNHNFSASASFGALVSSNAAHQRVPRAFIRVGSYELDNTNYALSGRLTDGRLTEEYPLDDSLPALRHAVWLSIDRAFRDASLSIAQKEVALRNLAVPELLPDFAKVEPVKILRNVPIVPVDQRRVEDLVRQASGVMNGYPNVRNSSVDLQLNQAIYYLLNTEGSALRIPDHGNFVLVRAYGKAKDGADLYDSGMLFGATPDQMPAPATLANLAKEVAENVNKLVDAPVGEPYVGPVLLEGIAGPQVIAQLIGTNLEVARKPVLPPNVNVPFPTYELESRLNARVLPDFLSVTDDPALKDWKGTPLLGNYEVDQEAVVPKPINVIEKGVLKAFLNTRTPRRNVAESNGRARLPGDFGNNGAVFFSNLIVNAETKLPAAELRKRFLDLVKERGKSYGIIVRKFDYPSIARVDQIREAISKAGGSAPLAPPLLVYKVYPDGREELIRGVVFKGLNARALRDIVAVSDQEHVFNFMGSRALWSLLGASSFVAGASVVAPSILLDEAELEKPQIELPKLPVVPPPARTSR